MTKSKVPTGAEIIAQCLVDHGVEYVYTIPGAKIDALHNAILDTSIKMVVCRHEQNAAFIAAAYGRLTGKPGVVIVTSGPGVGNLTTGLLTATSEGDPIVAIGGNVPLIMRYKNSHQSAENEKIMQYTTKYSTEILSPETIVETVKNSFYEATSPRAGACFISVPQDILMQSSKQELMSTNPIEVDQPIASNKVILKIKECIQKAKSPLVLLGDQAAKPENASSVRNLLHSYSMPCISTLQASGTISRELVKCWFERVGFFSNQLGDQIIRLSDLIITIGYDPIEYDPEIWLDPKKHTLIHINNYIPLIREHYNPVHICLGKISTSIDLLRKELPEQKTINENLIELKEQYVKEKSQYRSPEPNKIHPFEFINELQKVITDESVVISDIGTHCMWIARYLKVYQPGSLLFSNGQQTLGVALPWAIGAFFAGKKDIISISGDGGFLFSATEIETAVRVKANFIHFVWDDGTYNMVAEQQINAHSRKAAIDFGGFNVIQFAESFGAKGFNLDDINDLKTIIQEGRNLKGPVIVGVPIDYKDNHYLFEIANDDAIS